MNLNPAIRQFQPQDAQSLEPLIRQTFDRYIKNELSPEGQSVFFDMVARVVGNHYRDYMTFTALDDETPVGMLSLRQQTHICLFFCDKNQMNRGIGRALLNYAQQVLLDKLHRDITLTVNSSLFAVNIYQRLGFASKGGVERINGISFQAMEKHLLVGSS